MGGKRSALLVAGVLIAGAGLARRKGQSKAPEPPQPKLGRTMEASARAIQAMFIVIALLAFTLTYAPFAESAFMFWLFIGSMGVILITHLYLYFKNLWRMEQP